MSTFNPTLFAETQYTEALDTTVIPVPEGDWTAVIGKYEIRTPKDKVVLDVTWEIDSQEVQTVTGRDKNTVRQSIFLDITPHGTLDMSKGKNVQLGRLREALGQNQAGKPWSFGMLVGQVATVGVSHRTDDEGNIFSDVKRVAKLS